MKNLTRLLPLALLAWAFPASAGQQAFLVQNSGWMDPFYNDAGSQLKPLVLRVIEQATSGQDTIFVAAFNDEDEANQSPDLLYQGNASGLPDAVLSNLTIAKKKSGAWADTDLNEAIKETVEDFFQQKPGIIWIFTNNRNSPGNDPETVKRNLEFYNLLHNSPYIERTIAFPVKMRLQGKRYGTSGMMVYALAYGKSAGQELADLTASGRLKVFREAPARLKPLDQDAVLILPGDVKSKGIEVSVAQDGRTLVFKFSAKAKPDTIVLGARIRNLFYPYRIDTAAIAASYSDAGGRPLNIVIDPPTLSSVAPGAEVEIGMQIQVPLEGVPSVWSPESIAAMGDLVTVPAVIKLQLQNQKLSIDSAFEATLAQIFPGDPLSQVFRPSDQVRSSEQTIPVIFHIQYPMTPFLVVVIGALALVAVMVLLLTALRNPRAYVFNVEGENRTFRLKALQSVSVRDGRGESIGTVSRPLFGRPSCSAAEGRSIRFIK